MKTIYLLTITLLFLAACSSQAPVGIQQVTAEEFNELIQDDNVFVLDTHTPEQPSIPGTDKKIPYNQIAERMDELPVDLDTPIALYCRSGSMSAEASLTLQEMGYENIYDLQGGRNAYVAIYGE